MAIIDFFYDSDCPLADRVRDDLTAELAERGCGCEVVEHVDAGRLSPTVLVAGRDVVHEQPAGRGCRTDAPTREQIRAALVAAERGSA